MLEFCLCPPVFTYSCTLTFVFFPVVCLAQKGALVLLLLELCPFDTEQT